MKVKLLIVIGILLSYHLRAQTGSTTTTPTESSQQQGYFQQVVTENPALNASIGALTNPPQTTNPPKKGSKSSQQLAPTTTPTATTTPPNNNPNAPPPQNAVGVPNMQPTYPPQTLPQQNVNPVTTPTQAPKTTSTTTTTQQAVQPGMPTSSMLDTSRYIDTTKLPKSSIYGHDIFRNKNLALYNRSLDAQAMGNYIIGVGDQLGINVWGYSSYSGSYTVDETGSIMPEGVGKIYVKGLSLDKA